jgi:hypothetical protein
MDPKATLASKNLRTLGADTPLGGFRHLKIMTEDYIYSGKEQLMRLMKRGK